MREESFNSEWNYGSQYLYTIRQIENYCIQCSLEHDYPNWLNALKVFYRELSRRMTEEEKKEAKKLIREAETALSNRTNIYREEYFNSTELKGERELEELDCYLKEIIRKRKMDLPSKDDPGEAMLK